MNELKKEIEVAESVGLIFCGLDCNDEPMYMGDVRSWDSFDELSQ